MLIGWLLGLSTWQIAAVGLVVLLGLVVFAAYDLLRRWEEAKEQKLSVCPDVQSWAGNPNEIYAVLRVQTSGIERAKRCRGQLVGVAVFDESGNRLDWPRPHGWPAGLLAWSAFYGGGPEFDVQGEATLDIVALRESRRDMGYVVYADEGLRSGNPVHPRMCRYQFAIEVSADNAPVFPAEVLLYVTANGSVEFQDVSHR